MAIFYRFEPFLPVKCLFLTISRYERPILGFFGPQNSTKASVFFFHDRNQKNKYTTQSASEKNKENFVLAEKKIRNFTRILAYFGQKNKNFQIFAEKK